MAKAREKFPIGTQMRLAIELMNALALRRSDLILLGPPSTYDGVLADGRPATFLKYTQFKNRARHPSHIDTPIPTDVLAIIKATKTVGMKTWLVGARGKPLQKWDLTRWFTDQIATAGLPARCTPHGLRKRCCTDMAERGCTIHQIQSVSGHLTTKEVERYTKMADRARNARAAMAGRV